MFTQKSIPKSNKTKIKNIMRGVHLKNKNNQQLEVITYVDPYSCAFNLPTSTVILM